MDLLVPLPKLVSWGCWEVSRASEAGAQANPRQDRRDATRPARSAHPLPWDNPSGRLQPDRSSTDNVSTTTDPDHATTRTGDRGGADFECTGLGPTQLPKYRRLRPLARRFQARCAGAGHLATRLGGRRALPGARPAHHQHRPGAALLRADLPGDVRKDAARRAAH